MELFVGRQVEPGSWDDLDELRLDASRLRRHGVCFGMTGSGKTGLCISLLEEVAGAGVPILAIDPKGDLANLALLFDALTPERFAPWVDPAEAQRAGRTVEDHAAHLADTWRDGLASWGIGEGDLAAWNDRVSVNIYTPGSTSGLPIDVLGALRVPPVALADDDEGLRELVQGTIGSLLGLLGIEAEPLRDPRHIVLSRILEEGWREAMAGGPPVDLERIVVQLVDPPFTKVGVFPVDTFFPRDKRMDLALQLNGILAAPGFAAWSEGTPLDIDALLAPGPEGQTPVQVMYLAHLDEAQRHFVVAMILNAVVAWSRRQPGSGELRALVFFDEVMGYLPPHPRNPATKEPILRILKQARAVGLGAFLCTQNPVDVDYKALSNAGTWLVGRLSTKQDRERVLDGLAGAAAIDKGELSRLVDGLPSRTFVLRDVKESEPAFVRSRWAMSWLRGPLTRSEVARLEQSPPEVSDSAATVPSAPARRVTPATSRAPELGDGFADAPPPAPDGYVHTFLDPRVAFSARFTPFFGDHAHPPRADGQTVWLPALYARLHLRFDEGNDFVLDRPEHRLYFPIDPALVPCGEPEITPSDLLSDTPGGRFAPLPEDADQERELARIGKGVVEEVYRGETEHLFRHKGLRLDSRAGETREAFLARCAQAATEKADAEIAKLEERVRKEVDKLEDRRRDKERDLDKLRVEAKGKVAAEVMNAGEILYSLFFSGRKKSVSTAMSKRTQTQTANQKVSRAEEELTELEREIYDLDERTRTELLAIRNRWAAEAEEIEEIEVRLERNDITLDSFTILWVPVTRPI